MWIQNPKFTHLSVDHWMLMKFVEIICCQTKISCSGFDDEQILDQDLGYQTDDPESQNALYFPVFRWI